ncbi:MAG TPA: hypothetical protein VJ771_05145 [Candidatus Nitrosotalea sp.]|nr:hypothetical protein [Candidatus Nitrosotalea sp.]
MRCNNLYIILPIVLVFVTFSTIPSALATTVQVTITPGSGSGQNCEQTSTCFSPSIVNISPEDTVTWRNADNVAHSLTDGLPYGSQTGVLFSSGPIAPDTSYSFTFQNSGTFRYFATDTKWMVGEIIVGPSTGAAPAVPEFGSLAELVILVSIVGVIAVTRVVKF